MIGWTRVAAALVVVGAAALPALAAQAATPTPTPSEPTFSWSPPDLDRDRQLKQQGAQVYMDKVAAELGEPGVWVDPR